MTTITGHTLSSLPRGHGCTVCGRLWVEIIDQRARWTVGEIDIAHSGSLVEREVAELHAYDEARNAMIWDLVSGRRVETVGEGE